MRGLTMVRTITGTLLAVLLSAAALSIGPEPHSFGQSLGIMAFLGGPGYLLGGIVLALFTARHDEPGWKFRGTVVLIGMGCGLPNLLAVTALLAPFIGAYVLLLLFLFLVPFLAGGAGLGIGCLLGTGCRLAEEDP